MRSDASALLPADPALTATLKAAERTTGASTLLIELDGTEVERDELRAKAHALAGALDALPVIETVRGGPSEEGILDVGKRMTPHLTAFVPAEQLEDRLSEGGIRSTLRRQQDRLQGFAGLFLRPAVDDDPLDLRSLATATLGAPALRFRIDGDLLLDTDGSRALLIAETGRTPGAIQPNDPDILALERVFGDAGLPVRWFGGLRIASGTATTVAADVRTTSLIGIGLLTAVLLLGLRSWRPVVGALPPTLVAAGCTLVGAWWASPLHGIQIAFGAALAGLAVDYWIHLYLKAASIPATTWEERFDAAQTALQKLRVAMVVSAASTTVAFATLTTSDLPVVRTLGWTGGAAAVGALLGVTLLGPMAYAWVGRPSPRERGRRWPLALPSVLGLALLGLFGTGGSFDPDPMGLIARPDDVASDEAWFAEHYGLSRQRALVLLEGPDAHDRAARVQEALDGLGIVQTQGPASVLPSPAQQARRRQALRPVHELQADIDRIAAELGMGPFPDAAQRIHDRSAAVPVTLWDDSFMEPRVLLGENDALVTVPLPDPSVVPAFRDTLAAVDDAPLVVPSARATEGLEGARTALAQYGLLGLSLVYGLLVVRHRHPGRPLLALAPAGAALTGSMGAMALAGLPWNPVSLATLVPVLGLAVDYGVFVVEEREEARHPVGLSSLTTLAGFLPLFLASSPALAGVGIAMGAGIGSAAAMALWVVPALQEGALSIRVRTWLERAALAAVLFLHVDIGWIVFGSVGRKAPFTALPREVVQEGAERRSGPVRLVRTEGIHVLSTEGEPYAIGWHARRATAHLRPRLEEELFESFTTQVPNVGFRWLITRGSLAAGLTLEHHILPEHLVEIQGGDDASDDPYWLSGPSYTRKIYYHALHDIGQALVDSPLLACTGFMAGPGATTNGHWLLARNFDFEGGVAFDRDKVLRVHRSTGGRSYLSIGFAGMIGAVSGVNDAGIAVAINASGSSEPPRPGTPMTLILREILETATTLDDAERILRERTGFVSENVLVVDADHDRAALFEVTPRQVERIDVDGSLGVANHFRSPAFRDDPTNQHRLATSTTGARQARMDELLARHDGELDLEVALDLLTDRQGKGDAALPAGHRHALDAHIATHGVAIDATTRTVRVSRFPNLSAGFVELSLADALAGDLQVEEVRAPSGDAGAALGLREGRELLRRARRARLHEADRLTQEALRKMPGHPEALFERGRILLELGEEDAGRSLLEAARAAPPEYAHQIDAIEELLR